MSLLRSCAIKRGEEDLSCLYTVIDTVGREGNLEGLRVRKLYLEGVLLDPLKRRDRYLITASDNRFILLVYIYIYVNKHMVFTNFNFRSAILYDYPRWRRCLDSIDFYSDHPVLWLIL